MFLILAQTFNTIASVASSIFHAASQIGQFIVIIITTCINVLFDVVNNLSLFFRIVYEDNLFLFTEDFPNWSQKCFENIVFQFQFIGNLFKWFCTTIMDQIDLLVISIRYSTNTVFMIFVEVFYLIKNVLMLLGNSCWLILTFLPVHLPNLFKKVIYFLKDIIVSNAIDAYTGLLRFTNFLSDVPLESFLGLMTAVALLRIYLNFQSTINSQFVIIYWTAVRKVLYCYYAIYNYFTNPDITLIARMASGETMVRREINFEEDVDEDSLNADALCVICQERLKCVLTLPCRHVCLCRECCTRLYSYQRTCPICRTFIYHSVTVYL